MHVEGSSSLNGMPISERIGVHSRPVLCCTSTGAAHSTAAPSGATGMTAASRRVPWGMSMPLTSAISPLRTGPQVAPFNSVVPSSAAMTAFTLRVP